MLTNKFGLLSDIMYSSEKKKIENKNKNNDVPYGNIRFTITMLLNKKGNFRVWLR